jgi:serine/threonine protein phosphatase PrpC
MPDEVNKYQWHAFGDTVRGAAHERNGLPNQDHISWYPKPPWRVGPPLIMAVADGHGSAKCFRSNLGAEIATRRTKEAVRQILKSDFSHLDLSTIKRLIEERLPRDLIRNWQSAVDQHLEEFPLREEELAHLKEDERLLARKTFEESPRLAYGATLLVTLLTDTFFSFLQLGDGDILVVSENGEVYRPLPKDERLFANETTSLSGNSPWQDFRISFTPITDSAPALFLMSTDGYSNSFRDEESFLKVGKDLLEILRSDGIKSVRCGMRDWLNEASISGSGDDITLGLIFRVDAIHSAVSATDLTALDEPCSNSEEINGDSSTDGETQGEEINE